jgi:SAM-dependent methyltransferase
MTMSHEYWTRVWHHKVDPLHRGNDDAHYDLIAGELGLLLGSHRTGKVLDLGCGNSALLGDLGLDPNRYIGVDFSSAMLSAFRNAHPGARMEAADVRGYIPTEPLDLIISGSLLQYLSLADIDRHLGCVRGSLKPSGQILHSFVPSDVLRWPYYSGMLNVPQRGRIRAIAIYLAARFGLVPTLGSWHSIPAIREVAARHGLDAMFYGSLTFPYRFHVRMVSHG